MLQLEEMLGKIVNVLKDIPGVAAVVLGGSIATGTDTDASDVDIGVYYDFLDLEPMNRAAAMLDDEHRENLVCGEGGWGPWVNCGGWLTMNGRSVDLILRNVGRVQQAIEDTDSGCVTAHYQTGHPHAFLNAMYRGELAVCRPLWMRDDAFTAMKARAEQFPDAMREAMLTAYGFEMRFSWSFAEKYLYTGDAGYIAGHLFRSVSCMHQALFALNRGYCLNEKKAAIRVDKLRLRPENYSHRVNRVFELPAAEGIAELNTLVTEAEAIIAAHR